jgi:hypothetical protein
MDAERPRPVGEFRYDEVGVAHHRRTADGKPGIVGRRSGVRLEGQKQNGAEESEDQTE